MTSLENGESFPVVVEPFIRQLLERNHTIVINYMDRRQKENLKKDNKQIMQTLFLSVCGYPGYLIIEKISHFIEMWSMP